MGSDPLITTPCPMIRLNEGQKRVMEYVRDHPMANSVKISEGLEDLTVHNVRYALKRLQQLGLLEKIKFEDGNFIWKVSD